MTRGAKADRKVHEGRNLKHPDGYRVEMPGPKQDALAIELGDDWNQQKISLLEQKEAIDTSLLQQISAALKIQVEAILNFDEEQAVNIIANTFHDSAVANTITKGAQANFHCTFNPIDKWLEALEENKKLYERMIKEKDVMIFTLQAILENMKK